MSSRPLGLPRRRPDGWTSNAGGGKRAAGGNRRIADAASEQPDSVSLTLSTSDSKLKVIGQSSWSQEEECC